MLYKNLRFPVLKNRPYFYTNFVSTVDGKVQVIKNPHAYWPIGSKTDYRTLVELRAVSDVLIHGKNTAMWMRHVDNLAKDEFKALRKKLGKKRDLIYLIISNHPDKKFFENIQDPRENCHPEFDTLEKLVPLLDISGSPEILNPPKGISHFMAAQVQNETMLNYSNTFLVTSESALIPNLPNSPNRHSGIKIIKFGQKEVDLKKLSDYLFENGYKNVLIEGGPSLLGSFLAEGLLDEVFLTISPKIFGNENNQTLTMVESHLFPPNKVKDLELISVKKVENEVYLHYKVLS
ncbi:MAG: RibD family protein [Candidatus Levybacteria bacterium]|nr:RibD family protein [Candidatus Levybacteria bacterium]